MYNTPFMSNIFIVVDNAALERAPIGIGPIMQHVDQNDGSCHAYYVRPDGLPGRAVYDSLFIAWVDYGTYGETV